MWVILSFKEFLFSAVQMWLRCSKCFYFKRFNSTLYLNYSM